MQKHGGLWWFHPVSTKKNISGVYLIRNQHHGPLTRYVKLRVAHAPGMPGTVSPLPWVSDPDMHHGTCVTHVPWCMSGALSSGFLWNRLQGKLSRHFRRMRNPQFYVSGKTPMLSVSDSFGPYQIRSSDTKISSFWRLFSPYAHENVVITFLRSFRHWYWKFPFWWHFRFWLHQNLSKWQPLVLQVAKMTVWKLRHEKTSIFSNEALISYVF